MQVWKGIRVGLVSVAVLIALAAINNVAAAAGSDGRDRHVEASGGSAAFEHYGDTLRCADTASDGYGFRAQVSWSEAGSSYSFTVDCWGKGDVRQEGHNIPEGTKVMVRGCYLSPDNTVVRCTDKKAGFA